MAIEFSEGNFESEVLKSDVPVLVDFWATWCPPCRALSPVIDELASELDGAAKVGKVNIDDEKDIAVKYGINAIPTVLIFKDGEIVQTLVGAKDKQSYVDALGVSA